MGKFLVLALMALATPVFAQQQQQPECRGKSYFQLSGGNYGCALKVGSGNYTHTTTWDDGFTSKTKQVQSAVIQVALFGPFTDNGAKVKSRITALCKAFDGAVKQEMQGKHYTDVIVVMHWPRVDGPKGSDGKPAPARQAGFSTSKCRGANLFDR